MKLYRLQQFESSRVLPIQKTLEIIFEAYFYIKSSDRQKTDKCKAKQVAAQS